MKYSALGQTKSMVSNICLGSNVFGWNTDEATAHEILTEFSNLGGNFIDTADSYSVWVEGNPGGVSETIIGNWAATKPRGSLVIATKVGQMPDFPGYDRDYVDQQLDASLSHLQSSYVDVYYAHKDHEKHPMRHLAELFHDLVESRKIKNIGLSNFSVDRTREWLAVADQEGWHRPSVIQPHYNLMVRADYESGLGVLAQEESLSVAGYAGLARGFLTGRYSGSEAPDSAARATQALQYATKEGFAIVAALRQIAETLDAQPASVALAWVLRRPEVISSIVSASSASHLPALAAASDLVIPHDLLEALSALPNGEATD
jgi:aryl-alcohol dehydrogenase (NADP+)